MNQHFYSDGKGYKIAAALVIVIFAILLAFSAVGAAYVSQPGSRHYTCSDFGSYSSLIETFPYGSWPKYLDSNNDGIPCNALYDKEYPKV